MKRTISTLLALFPGLGFSQTFQDLDFESGSVSNPDSLHRVAFTNAFPGWQANSIAIFHDFNEGGPVQYGYYNSSDLDQITIGLYDRNATPSLPHPVLGTYTAYIEGDLGSARYANLDLTQMAFIPLDAKSLRFATSSYSSLAGFSAQMILTVGAQGNVPYYAADVQPNYTIWAADISPSAGTISEIGFHVSASYPFVGAEPHIIFGIGLDNIDFSSIDIPEPPTSILLVTALACLWLLSLGRHTMVDRPVSNRIHSTIVFLPSRLPPLYALVTNPDSHPKREPFRCGDRLTQTAAASRANPQTYGGSLHVPAAGIAGFAESRTDCP